MNDNRVKVSYGGKNIITPFEQSKKEEFKNWLYILNNVYITKFNLHNKYFFSVSFPNVSSFLLYIILRSNKRYCLT